MPDGGLWEQYCDPSERHRRPLGRTGFDQAVLFPNYGIIWERALDADLAAATGRGPRSWTTASPRSSTWPLALALALALTDLIIKGVLERHPDLRLGVMELSAVWVPLRQCW